MSEIELTTLTVGRLTVKFHFMALPKKYQALHLGP